MESTCHAVSVTGGKGELEQSIIYDDDEDTNYNSLLELVTCSSSKSGASASGRTSRTTTPGSDASNAPRKKRKLEKAQVPAYEDTSVFRLVFKDTHQDQLRIMQNSLTERYSKNSDVKAEYGWPVRYRYVSDNEDTSLVQFHGVHISEGALHPDLENHIVSNNCMSVWMKLWPVYLDKLYVLLCLPTLLYECLTYDDTLRGWIINECKADATEAVCLTLYGSEEKTYMTNHLRRDRTQEEMGEAIRGEHSLKLYWRWVRAWEQKMSNGVGRAAVGDLMDAIIELLDGFHASFPAVELTHVSSSTPDNCFQIGSSSSGEGDSGKQCENDGERDEEDNVKSRKWNSPGQYVDLFIASYDKTSDVAKYLFPIKIHGKNFDIANQKFCREIVHVLQSQTEVYGLFVGVRRARLYKGLRNSSQRIIIFYKDYNFAYNICPSSTNGVVNVEVFQRFIMDIFTCLVQSIFIAV